MAEFSEVVYRGHGPYQRKGGGFSTLGVTSQEALKKALADGWFRTLPEAIQAHDDAKLAQSASAKPATQAAPANASQDAPPTRDEIEQKCKELGIKVHTQHKDATLLRLIDEAMAKSKTA